MLQWHLFILISVTLLNGETLGNPSTTVSHPIRHSLPTEVLQPLFGSQATGRCTSVAGNICNGTSVLNDGIMPTLRGISTSCPESEWANQLFTMRRNLSKDAGIVLSFEVERANHDRVELVVFNCPEHAIYTPVVKVYIDTSFNPERLGNLQATQVLSSTSCDHLIRFCVDLNAAVSVTVFDLEFPYQNNSDFVFLAEVTFLDGGAEPCSPPELITVPVTRFLPTIEEITLKPTTVTSTATESESPSITLPMDSENSCFFAALIAGGAGALGSAILVLCVSVIIHVAVYRCVYKPRLKRSQAVLANAIDDLYKKADSNNISTLAAEHEYSFIYEAIGERASTAGMEVEMKRNEIYGLVGEPSES